MEDLLKKQIEIVKKEEEQVEKWMTINNRVFITSLVASGIFLALGMIIPAFLAGSLALAATGNTSREKKDKIELSIIKGTLKRYPEAAQLVGLIDDLSDPYVYRKVMERRATENAKIMLGDEIGTSLIGTNATVRKHPKYERLEFQFEGESENYIVAIPENLSYIPFGELKGVGRIVFSGRNLENRSTRYYEFRKYEDDEKLVGTDEISEDDKAKYIDKFLDMLGNESELE